MSKSRTREQGVADAVSGVDCCVDNSYVDSAVASVHSSYGFGHVGCFKESQGVGLIPETWPDQVIWAPLQINIHSVCDSFHTIVTRHPGKKRFEM